MATDDDNTWQVVCRGLSGVLVGSKFKSLTRGDCIRLGYGKDGYERMVTPKSFLDEAGAASDRGNWRRIIEVRESSHGPRQLQHIIDSGLLSSHKSSAEACEIGKVHKPSKQSRKRLSTSDPMSPKARRFKASAVHFGKFGNLQTLLKDLNQVLRSSSARGTQEQQTAIRQWQSELKSLIHLSDETADEELTIGIVGRTGVGKSSLLNAIIDEPLLLPVSSFKACTSVPIKIRSSSNEGRKYRARIEFLTKKEWLDELKSLCEDIASYGVDESSPRRYGDRVSKQIHDIAAAKLKAVYGDGDVHTSYEELKSRKNAVTEESFQGDNWKDIEADASADLGSQLSKYIVPLPPKKKKRSDDGEWWPLVNSVSISIPNCEALPPGVALVDLPGIRDANAAQVAVTDEILKSCDVVWIVCQMTRSTDDEAFVGQVEDEYKRQLDLDGQTSTLVVICTKTDELSSFDVERELDAFGLEEEAEGKSMEEMTMLVAKERNKWATEEIKRECQEQHARAASTSEGGQIGRVNVQVFPVSARDYHELSRVAGPGQSLETSKRRLYDTPDDTGIPAVQFYLRNEGTAALEKKLKRVVTDSQLLSQEVLLSLSDKGTPDSKKRIEAHEAFGTYFNSVTKSDTENVIEKFKHKVRGHKCLGKLETKLDKGISLAVETAKSEVTRWAELNSHTYKEVCLRFGEFHGSKSGPISFNSDLARPIIDTVSMIWEEVYGPTEGMIHQLAHKALQNLKTTFTQRVDSFKQKLSIDIGISSDRLKPAILRADRLVEETSRTLSKIIKEERKDAHRSVKFAIQWELKPAYDKCAEQRGPGTLDRMKAIMTESVTQGSPLPKVFLKAKERLISHCGIVTDRIAAQLTILGQNISSIHAFQHLWRCPGDAPTISDIEDIASKLQEV